VPSNDIPVSVDVSVDVIRPATPSAEDLRWRKVAWFALANVIALAIAGAIFALLLVGISEGGGFDRAMERFRYFLRSHMAVAALAAATPFFASLLVGQYEMRRARARRRRKEAEERRERIAAELEADRAARAARRSG
jgi:hypothetical protein